MWPHLIPLLKATKQSIIKNKWGAGYHNHCAQWHYQQAAKKLEVVDNRPTFCGCGIESFMFTNNYRTSDIFIYNDTCSKWDMIALLGKFIRYLEAEESDRVVAQYNPFNANYTQQETNDV